MPTTSQGWRRGSPTGATTLRAKTRSLSPQEVYPALTSRGTWRVAEHARAPVVLIVDEDLGFVWWLSEIFSAAGCQVVPALNCGQTISITQELNLEFDVIVLNPELAGISEMMQTLSTGRTPKIVAISNHDAGSDGAVHADATLQRPSGWGAISEREWLGCVRKVVTDVQAAGV